jgi:hypothetical protein
VELDIDLESEKFELRDFEGWRSVGGVTTCVSCTRRTVGARVDGMAQGDTNRVVSMFELGSQGMKLEREFNKYS